ncbi:MAG: hypothetical protein CMB80_33205 [Flammeovirgaceae bacterium]|nr:hypothetical protein [Flammeovirgaceae bacterium]
MIQYKATTLDRSSQTEIQAFNSLLSTYQGLIDPEVETKRDTLKDKFNDMKDLFAQTVKVTTAPEPK